MNDDEIREQQEFVEWLKSQGLYNPMESALVMSRTHNIYKALNKSRDEEVQRLEAENELQVGANISLRVLFDDLEAENKKLRADCKRLHGCIGIKEDEIESLTEDSLDLSAENKKLRGLLESALPNMECKSYSQDRLISLIGEALKEGE